MFFKPRCEPEELRIMRHLHARMNLNEKEVNNFLTMEKGYDGEKKFDKLLEGISDDCIILNDLLLEQSNSIFQIDSLLIYDGTIHIINIKNYEGDYYIDSEKWFRVSNKKEISNPFFQLNRSESLMRRLLKDIGYNLQIKAYIIFINPDFVLYQAPLNLPIIFSSQLNRFLNQFKTRIAVQKEKYFVLAEKITSLHIKNSPYMNLPEYSYEQLIKGITCQTCYTFISEVSKDKIACNECGFQEDFQSAIIRSVEEYRLLFPLRKITTEDIWEWCKVIDSRKTIRRILKRNFNLIGYGKSSHYIDY
ncbi:nuclease-related domain-containing protein [Bacillus sp. JJ1532]|uniref:nuclease-related domain-containing protein n=1 Tax=Bacillus sp. JJ1532 TaxID=3122958 RepID=UPI002FFF35B8